MGGGAVGRTVVRVAVAKQQLPWQEAFVRGMLCNVLVCMAVWMAMAGRSVVDRAVAIVFPITAFVAAGFEHSIANMYLLPLAMLVQSSESGQLGSAITLSGMAVNLGFVTAGNLVGGTVLVGLTYHFIYGRQGPGQLLEPRETDAESYAGSTGVTGKPRSTRARRPSSRW